MSDSPSPVGFQAPEPNDLAALFPGYEIEFLIATGGMGAVYRAVQKSLDRTVALKILPPELSADAAFCAGFSSEAKAMAKLNHPNLIGVYDFGEVNGMLFLVMEYVHGQSLFHSSNGQAIDPKEVIRLVTGIGSGLAHAHQHGILHRDIKPANILLDAHIQPKIGDFGLARPVDMQVQDGDEIFGTPHYTAPEVVNAPQSVDYRADIFSLGVMLHELLTGKLPADDPRPPSQIIGCDRRFDEIVNRATYPDPAYRYGSVMELVADLQVIAQGPAPKTTHAPHIHATPVAPPAPRRPTKKVVVRKKSSGPSVGMVLLILALAGAGGYVYYKRQPPAASTAAPVPQVSQEPELPKAVAPTPKVEENENAFGSPSNDDQPTSSSPAQSSAFGAPLDEEPPPPSHPSNWPPPKFDVGSYLQRGRKGMQRIAAGPLQNYQQGMKANCQTFETALANNIRKLIAHKRDAAMQSLEQDYKQWKADGYRVPASMPSAYDSVGEVETFHESALKAQEKLEEQLNASLRGYMPTYLTGIQKQIDQLRVQSDPGAILLLEQEADKLKSDPDYFPSIITGRGTSSN
ncbi:MAG: serine/threonine-protein kinase [Luteolibacter sp.]